VIRPAVLFLLGVWLGLLLASWLMAPATFRTVDRVLAAPRPELGARLSSVPADDRRLVLRHLAAEVNRWMFGTWGVAQLILGIVVCAATWRMGGAARGIALAALAVVLGQTFGLVPAVRDLGRAVEFSPPPMAAELRGRFGALHGAYAVLDLGKAALISALAWLAARS
jgi:hypothetical protein